MTSQRISLAWPWSMKYSAGVGLTNQLAYWLKCGACPWACATPARAPSPSAAAAPAPEASTSRKRTGASVTQSIVLAQDQIAKLAAAAGGRPPFDVAMLDDPQALDAVKQRLVVEYPIAKSPHFKELLSQFQDPWGPKISMQVIGIGYNPKKITTP